jgi:hypothetical protein
MPALAAREIEISTGRRGLMTLFRIAVGQPDTEQEVQQYDYQYPRVRAHQSANMSISMSPFFAFETFKCNDLLGTRSDLLRTRLYNLAKITTIVLIQGTLLLGGPSRRIRDHQASNATDDANSSNSGGSEWY